MYYELEFMKNKKKTYNQKHNQRIYYYPHI